MRPLAVIRRTIADDRIAADPDGDLPSTPPSCRTSRRARVCSGRSQVTVEVSSRFEARRDRPHSCRANSRLLP